MDNAPTNNLVPPNFTSADIVNIGWSNIKFIKPEDLEREEIYQKFRRFVEDIDVANEGINAKQCFDVIWKLLSNNPKLGDKSPSLLRKYFELLLVLRANFLDFIGDREIEKFLRENVLFAFSIQMYALPYFDFQSKIDLFLTVGTWYLDKAAKKELRNEFVRVLESNMEFLGDKELELKGHAGKYIQNMSNWLRDYNQVALNQGRPRDAVERVKYLTQSLNAKNLDDDQKKLLLKFLEFYDWLRFEHNIVEKETGHTLPVVQQKPVQAPIPSAPMPPAPHGAPLEEFKAKMEAGKGEGGRGEGTTNIRMTPQEIKRETSMVELPASPKEELLPRPVFKAIPTPPLTSPRRLMREGASPLGGEGNRTPQREKPLDLSDAAHLKTVSLQTSQLNNIQTIDDLKKISLVHLRQGNVSVQVDEIKNKIMALAVANHVLPYYAVVAFEQSSLFKAYLQIGSMMINDTTVDRASAFKAAAQKVGSNLTLPEFEAIADMRKEIEKM